ncbi:DUF262 domain-containing protein [Acidithiobacillus sp.]|uniref:DUF262 domain-containing protein n=1 Tax=Acidithiobacillus sp. TaxID=1872118 RepID=UPI0025BCBD76|nr:DUF262 domain-containing protein [Acidithiobacillus sp.]
MTIEKKGVRTSTVGELLEEHLQIPSYQRPYSWWPETALQLLDDLRDAAQQRDKVSYVLGAVILHHDGKMLNVVDGQQRLLTLRILLDLLENQNAYEDLTNPPGKDTPPIVRVIKDLKREIKCSAENAQADATTQSGANQANENKKLADFIKHKCQMIRIETDDIDEAFRVFDSQNYRGKPLAPHDLLKAYHLRAMRHETAAMKVALIDAWESAGDAALDHLFSRYLYRITRWSRGENAPQFTERDIDLFKGIDPSRDSTPYARYHSIAQTAMPLLSLLDANDSDETSSAFGHASFQRVLGHARFQLDAPVVAGRLFFERVTFMLGEVNRLIKDIANLYAAEWPTESKPFPFYRVSGDGTLIEQPPGRYRYVSELYLAAALYYVNKFGMENFERHRDLLFAWAYALRTGLLRVQYRSVDNHASENEPTVSAFKLIRNARSANELRGLSLRVLLPKGHSEHEEQLANFLRHKGFEISESQT